jgi:hypothetical protein
MTVEFTSPEHLNTDAYLLRWFDAGNAMVKETSVQRIHTSVIAGTSPPRYQISALSIEKPAGAAGALFTVTVTGHNSQGDSPSSAPSAPFTLTAPLTQAPSNVVVSNLP